MNSHPYTLVQLQREVKEQIHNSFAGGRWVVAEIGQLNNASTGHCYLELVEHNESSGQLAAKCQATIWRNSLSGITRRFQSSTGYQLGAGMKILALVQVNYHELYGISLNITDIDPSFTIGEMELKRREIIKKLTSEGLLERNRAIGAPILMQRVAVVSSSKAAGYGDFCNELLGNEYGYYYNITLFNAIMQGAEAEESIISALEQIYDNYESYDCIVIIRGGGSKSDLACFDSYPISEMIAYSPLIVISGIGHDRDESIADMVVAKALKTPTAVARFLIDQTIERDNQLSESGQFIREIFYQELKSREQELSGQTRNIERILNFSVKEQSLFFARSEQSLKHISLGRLKDEFNLAEGNLKSLSQCSKELIDREQNSTESVISSLKELTNQIVSGANSTVQMQQLECDSFDPKRIFEMGYSFAKISGRVLRSTKEAKIGDKIDVKLRDGILEADIININNG